MQPEFSLHLARLFEISHTSSKKLKRYYPVVSKKCGNKVRVEMRCWHKKPMAHAWFTIHPVSSELACVRSFWQYGDNILQELKLPILTPPFHSQRILKQNFNIATISQCFVIIPILTHWFCLLQIWKKKDS